MIIELEKIGLHNPTRVKCNGRVLETQGLSVEQLVSLWKAYYEIPPFVRIYLEPINDKLYYSLYQKPITSPKSLLDLFKEQGVYVVKKRSEINNVKD